MKKIKEILNNENNIEKLFKNNNNNHLKTLQNKYMITEYNFSSNTSRKLHKFGKTTINFNNIINSEKKPIHIQNPFKKINNSKDESHNKIKLKLKLTNINKNKSYSERIHKCISNIIFMCSELVNYGNTQNEKENEYLVKIKKYITYKKK